MKSVLGTLALGALLAISSAVMAADAPDPVIGTWKLNAAKSTGTTLPKSETRTYAASAAGGIVLTWKRVGADGKQSSVETTYKYDGKDYPVTGSPDFDAVSVRRVDANTVDSTQKRMGKAVEKWLPPKREELDDNDSATWENGHNGKPKDPWSFQHLLPFEHLESGEVVIFVTQSVGGKIATEELVREYARRLKRKRTRALPIVKLASKDMPTNNFGEVPRPYFEIDGWEDAPAGDPKESVAGELNDTIPF